MRSSLLIAATTLLAGCATTSLQESTPIWQYGAVAEHHVQALANVSVSLFPDGAVGRARVRMRAYWGELADYDFPDGATEMVRATVRVDDAGTLFTDDGRHFLTGTLVSHQRGFEVPSKFEDRGNACCDVVAGDLSQVRIGAPVHPVAPLTGEVAEAPSPLARDSAVADVFIAFDPAASELSIYVPPPGGRTVRRDDHGELVSVRDDGGWRLRFHGPQDWGYVRSRAAVTWYYAHLPFALVFDTVLLPFSLVKVLIHTTGLEDGRRHPFLWPWQLPPPPPPPDPEHPHASPPSPHGIDLTPIRARGAPAT